MEQAKRSVDVEVGWVTDVGLVRDHNEDAVLVQQLVLDEEGDLGQGTLCAVADGMGGHQAGEVASAIALEALESHLRESLRALTSPEPSARATALAESVQHANAVVFSENASANQAMGTTLVA